MHRTSDILFFLEVPPNVILSGPHHPVVEGDNVTLTCNLTNGVPKPELIRWLRANISLDKKNTTMVLRNIKKDQEGTYTCETSNEGGSAKASIKVIVDSKTLMFCWYAWNVARKEHLIDPTVHEIHFFNAECRRSRKAFQWKPKIWYVMNPLLAKSNELLTDSFFLKTVNENYKQSVVTSTFSEDWKICLKINDGFQRNQNILTTDQECIFGSQTKTNIVENTMKAISDQKSQRRNTLRSSNRTLPYTIQTTLKYNYFKK